MLTLLDRALDELATFETASLVGQATTAPARYAIRQALDQEYQKFLVRERAAAAQSKFKADSIPGQNVEAYNAVNVSAVAATGEEKQKVAATRRDFFGRTVIDAQPQSLSAGNGDKLRKSPKDNECENKVWVSFHEGFSNAVRKPITLEELIRDF